MRIEHRVVFVFWAVFAVTPAAWAVSGGTVCATGCEFASLQEAVDASDWGAAIELGPGVYVENVVVRGALTIRGAGAERTVIDGGSRDAALRLEGPLAYRVRLEDLTIRSGLRGGISAATAEVSLERCVVRGTRSAGSLHGGRDVGGQTDRVVAARSGAARSPEHGVRSSPSSVSSTWEQSVDAGSEVQSDGDPPYIAFSGGGPAGGVTLCHISPGNAEFAQTIVVGQTSVVAHLAHGDSLGACPGFGCVESPVPQTGQTGCWGDEPDYPPVDCQGTGQDGEHQAGVSVDPRFTDNGNGTVTDNLTGSIWLQNADCFGSRSWTDALSDVKTLASGSCGLMDGSVLGDWRLPNVRELHSLIDYGQYIPAHPLDHPFSGVHSYYYWSSTGGAHYRDRAWSVYLYNGNVNDYLKTNSFYVWPVRNGQ